MTEKTLSIPLWFKLTSGETLFGELTGEKDGVFFVKNPYSVTFINRGDTTNVALQEWISFSNNNVASITASNVVSMGNLDADIKKTYGEMLLQNDVGEIKQEIYEMMLATPALKPEWIEEKLNEIMKRIVSHSVRFDTVPPPFDDISDSLYTFIIKENEPETATRH